MNRSWAAACLVGAVLALSGCDDVPGFERAREDFHYSYALQPGGQLDIENVNGSIDISGWDRSSIEVSGTKFAPTDANLKNIQVRVNINGNAVSIRTENPQDFIHGGFGARYVIRVPRQITLGRARTTNGSFSVEDLQGGGSVKSTNGRITMARNQGDYDIGTTNGTIELDECSGVDRAQTTNGSIRGRLKSGAIEARSTNGGIDFTILKPQDDKPIRLSTTNGAITLALAEFHGNAINAETSHGSLTLRLPAGTNAQLSARNSFAGISSDLPLSSTEEISKHRFKGQLGQGGPLISASTTSGSIRIEKY